VSERNTLTSCADRLRRQSLAVDITSWSTQDTPQSDTTSEISWSTNTPPSTPSLVPSTGTTPELPPLPTPTSSPNFSFLYEFPCELECSECHTVFKAPNGDTDGLKGRLTRHLKTSCPKSMEKQCHKCRACDKVYGRSDSKLKHEREKHSDELADVLTPKRRILDGESF
jgi:hypothetical protein